MVKLVANYTLCIFTVAVFFLLQVANVNANYLKNSSLKEDSSPSIIKHVENKTIHTASIYVPTLSYGTVNESALEGKVEKVAAFTIGAGVLLGGFIITTLLNWITQIVAIFK
ncbi:MULTISPECIES: hypothetical protein [unclassified Bartonella]|uniref:hypothetical protein n=1 Tax=unclassified Bartonella TaxID=2645622 RepID=UPI0035D0A3D8